MRVRHKYSIYFSLLGLSTSAINLGFILNEYLNLSFLISLGYVKYSYPPLSPILVDYESLGFCCYFCFIVNCQSWSLYLKQIKMVIRSSCICRWMTFISCLITLLASYLISSLSPFFLTISSILTSIKSSQSITSLYKN